MAGAGRVGTFLGDERGTASLEFVVALPLLMVPLILFAEYGEALSKREQLDSALADAVQLLAASPAWPGATPSDPPQLLRPFVDRAARLVAQRMGQPVRGIAFSYDVTPDLSAGSLRIPFHLITVRASVVLDQGLLSFINAFTAENDVPTVLVLAAEDSARYVSAVPPIELTGCTFETLAADCGTPPAEVVTPDSYAPPTDPPAEAAPDGPGT